MLCWTQRDNVPNNRLDHTADSRAGAAVSVWSGVTSNL